MKSHVLCMCIAVHLFALGSGNAQSLWQWQMPSPQGNNIYDVDIYAPSHAVAVGEYGTVLLSTDSGANWTLAPALDGVPTLNGVSFLDAATLIAVGPGGVIVRSTNGGSGWTAQSSGVTSTLHAVDFSDASHGFAVGYGGTILHSTDGGVTWTAQTSGTSATLHGVSTVDANTATVVGTGGTILRTIDGGTTWTAQTSGVTLVLYGVDFLDANTGTAVGQGPTAIATTDGGTTWTPQPIPDLMLPPDFIELHSVHMLDAMRTNIVGFHVGLQFQLEFTGILLQTTDGGSNWSEITPLGYLHGIHMFDANVGIAVGAAGVIRRTTDGGQTWAQIAGGEQAYSMHGVDFFDAQHGVAIANETRFDLARPRAYTTIDGGSNWTITGPFPGCGLLDVTFADASTVYVVGRGPRQYDSGALIYRSDDAGMNWTQIFGSACIPGHPCIQAFRAVDFAGPNTGVAVGNGGEIVTILAGVPTQVTSPTMLPLNGVSVPTSQTAYAVGEGGVILKGDLVADVWAPQTSGTSTNLYDVCFTTELVGTAVGYGTILRTTDGGATWIPQVSGAQALFSHVSFLDQNHGIVLSEHSILKTNDGGNTWASEDLPTGRQYGESGGIDYIDTMTIAAVGGHLNILARRDIPVAILFENLTAQVQTSSVQIEWTVFADETIRAFHVYRSDGSHGELTLVRRLDASKRSYTDKDVTPGTEYQYALAAVGAEGNEVLSRTIAVKLPRVRTTLFQNHPNPFNPFTTIRFQMSQQMDVTLKIHDVAGRFVATLVDETLPAGAHTALWDGRDHSGAAVGTGIYFCTLRTKEGTWTRRMLLLQ